MYVLIIIALILAIVPLILILGDVILKGASTINLTFLTQLPAGPFQANSGIANTIYGTFIMVGVAALIAIPIGVGAGIYFSEWPKSKISIVGSFLNDVLTGYPTIVLGLFIYLIIAYKNYSAFAGALALSLIMLPIIARTTDESLKLVPATLREASMALGISRWRTIFKVVISTGKTGLLTGIILAIARATGETAPLLVTAGYSTYFINNLFRDQTGSMTVLIYNYGVLPYPIWQSQAWAAALVLIVIMLALNLFVKLVFGRSISPIRIE